MLVLKKGIDFEIDKDDINVKMVEKKEPDNQIKMLSEPNISYKPFWGNMPPPLKLLESKFT